MADLNERLTTQARAPAYATDAGLRAYMIRVYQYMALGLALTGVVSLMTAQLAVTGDATGVQIARDVYLSPLGQALYLTPLKWVVMLAPLGLVMWLSFGVHRMSASTAQGVYWIYAAVMGLSLSSIFFLYTAADITRVFFITAASFGALSLYGYTTKRDLTAMGSFMFIGLIGIILAAVVNIFLKSSGLDFAISVIGVLVFAGLTAYDTQKIKEMYVSNMDGTAATKTAVMGALSLYLDFINMFLMLLRLFGNSRN